MLKSVQMLTIAALAIPTVAQANLIENGSFEVNALGEGQAWAEIVAGDTTLAGWTSFGNGVDIIGTLWAASHGSNSIDMNAYYAGGGIEQSFSTVIGETYQVSFDMSANMFLGPDMKVMGVSAAGVSEEFSFDYVGFESSAIDPKWTTIVWDFTAVDTTTTLSFYGVNDGAAGAALDNVVVTQTVPAPGALAGLGLAGLFAGRRRR